MLFFKTGAVFTTVSSFFVSCIICRNQNYLLVFGRKPFLPTLKRQRGRDDEIMCCTLISVVAGSFSWGVFKNGAGQRLHCFLLFWALVMCLQVDRAPHRNRGVSAALRKYLLGCRRHVSVVYTNLKWLSVGCSAFFFFPLCYFCDFYFCSLVQVAYLK